MPIFFLHACHNSKRFSCEYPKVSVFHQLSQLLLDARKSIGPLLILSLLPLTISTIHLTYSNLLAFHRLLQSQAMLIYREKQRPKLLACGPIRVKILFKVLSQIRTDRS